MADYKADITLNEKDSLIDMLNAEKNLVKVYSTAMTEGCSKGFRQVVHEHWGECAQDQMNVFLQMTEHGYYQVESAPEQAIEEQKQKFCQVAKELS